MSFLHKIVTVGSVLVLITIIAGCTAGPESRFLDDPAGFWAGLWHGLICVITFIISLFSDSVRMYEVNNTGGWYDFGFILGACIALGGGGGAGWKKKRRKRTKDKEWEEIGKKVEEKVCKGIKEWLDESENKDDEWEEIGRKIEEKIKRKLRDWAED
jgi:hypothetical protein